MLRRNVTLPVLAFCVMPTCCWQAPGGLFHCRASFVSCGGRHPCRGSCGPEAAGKPRSQAHPGSARHVPGAADCYVPLVVARFCVYYPSGLLVGVILVPLTTAVLWDALAWDVVFVVPWPFLYDLRAQAFAILYQLIERTTAVFGSAPGFLVGHEALSLAFMAFPCLHVPASRGSQGRRLES